MTDPERDAHILEQIRWDLARLDMQARAIGQPLLAFMLDQAACLAERELQGLRAAGPSRSGEARRRAS